MEVSSLGRFTPGKRATGTHLIGGWVGPRADLDTVEKRTILPLPGIESLGVHPVARHYTNWAISTPRSWY
jgi:hypothetical protein